MPTNHDICKLWAVPFGDNHKSNRSMRVSGPWLISYGTAIAYRDDASKTIIFSEDTFSVTTAKQMHHAWHAACDNHYLRTTLPCFGYGKTRPFTSSEDAYRDAAAVIIDRFYAEVDRFNGQRNAHHRFGTLKKAAAQLDAYDGLPKAPKLPAKARKAYRKMLSDLSAKLTAMRLAGDSTVVSLANKVG
jgi:hypothetical protein